MFSVVTQNFGYKDGSSIYKISAGQDLTYILVVQTSLWNVTCILDMPTKSFKTSYTDRIGLEWLLLLLIIVPNKFPNQRLQIFSFLPGYESFTLQYFLSYGPAYQLDIPPSQRQDMNTPEDLANVLNTVTGNFNILTPCGFTLFCLFFGEKLFKIILNQNTLSLFCRESSEDHLKS